MTHRSTLAEFTLVGAFAAGVVALALRYVLDALPGDEGFHAQAVTFLSGIGAFVLFFRASIAFYYAVIWRIVHGQRVVAGGWAYTYNARYDHVRKCWDPASDQPGFAFFEHTVDGIHVQGQSSPPPPSKGTTNLDASWESTAVAINDFRLNLTVTLRSEDGSTEGFVVLHIIPEEKILGILPRKPKMMRGYYYLFDRSQQSNIYARVELTRAVA